MSSNTEGSGDPPAEAPATPEETVPPAAAAEDTTAAAEGEPPAPKEEEEGAPPAAKHEEEGQLPEEPPAAAHIVSESTVFASDDAMEANTTSSSMSLKDEIKVVQEEDDKDGDKDDKDFLKKHVAPHVENIQAQTTKVVSDITKNIDTHVTPKVKEFQQNTAKTFDTIGKNTKGAIDTHVVPHYQNVEKKTKEAMDTLGKNTKSTMDTIGKNTKSAVDSIGKNTKSTMDAIGQNTKNVVVMHVKPQMDNLHKQSQRAIADTQTMYQERVLPVMEPHITKAQTLQPYYWNLAPYVCARRVHDFLPDRFASRSLSYPLLLVLESTLRSFGQVVFCNNPITGILVFFAILISAPGACLCALLSTLTLNATAIYLHMDETKITKGLYGYNAVLVGTGTAIYLSFDDAGVISLLISIVAGLFTLVASTVGMKKLDHMLHLPANLILIVMLLSAMLWDDTTVVASPLSVSSDELAKSKFSLFGGLVQMYLVPLNGISGFLVLVGMLLCSRILAVAAVIGWLLGCLLLTLFFEDDGAWNTALTCIAMMLYVKISGASIGFAILGVVLTLIMQSALVALYSMISLPLSPMTLPFCLATGFLLVALDTVDENIPMLQLMDVPPTELTIPEDYVDFGSKEEEQAGDEENGQNEAEATATADAQTPVKSQTEEAATESTPLLLDV